MYRISHWTKLAFIAAVCASMTAGAAAQTFTVLHNMKSKEGTSPVLGVILDSSGNIYGVAGEGGTSNAGSVFELIPSGTSYTEKTLYSFRGGADGGTPVASVIMDKSGNLYGTTKLGGSRGMGVAYKLTKSGGTWSESVLHTFGGSGDGQYPVGNLIFDSAGNLYGTTEGGGSHGNGQQNIGGTAFKLSPKPGGGWTETIMHSFGGRRDGISPRANLVEDSSGNFYGTTFLGGTNKAGIAFKLAPKSGGGWTETILHNFDPLNDGGNPAAGLILDSERNLYGTAVFGGYSDGGTVFQLSPSGSTWTLTVLINFRRAFYLPTRPYSGLLMDKSGNIYGTTLQGGYDLFPSLHGAVFELTPDDGYEWNYIVLYDFDGTHGSGPGIGSLIFDPSGNIYGAAQNGGANKVGVVFKIAP